jgi:uncharacterized membrane protein/murein tripeptide amidase MpaA
MKYSCPLPSVHERQLSTNPRKEKESQMKKICIIFLATLVFSLGLVGSALASRPVQQDLPEQPVVARVYFTSRADLDSLAAELDIWEVDHAAGYLVAMLSPEHYATLEAAGYRLEIDDEKTAAINQPLIPLPGQGPDSIPGFPCYRTVEETYASIWDLEQAYPNLVMTMTYGSSWDKINPGGPAGYDLYVMRMTNEAIPGPKPTFFLMAEIHARELVTAESAMRFAEYLAQNYGTNPDITWLLNYYEIHIVPITNPDGRKFAETGEWWRKNTDNDDGCTAYPDYGTDLNRNHSFKWNTGGSSGNPCGETYHGPSASSEPEVQAIQNYVLGLFPDQRGPGDFDAAPLDSTGLFITLHSYSQLVLWPWGWTGNDSPNHVQLQTFGRRLAYFNFYTPQQSNDLYPTSGTSEEWAYGELGVAGYTYEMGTTFFQDCGSYEGSIWPNNRDSLLNGFKAARRPYMEPAGPESLSPAITPSTFTPGENVLLTATANGTRYNNSNGVEPTQNIAAARYAINELYWFTDATTYPMAASDGNFNATIENIQATLDTSQMLGRYTFYIESQDANNDWGVTSAVYGFVPIGMWPDSDSAFGLPSETVTYTLELGNGEDTPQSYDIQVDSQWPVSAPATLGPILPGERLTFDVVVTIPISATNSDVATVTAASQGNPNYNDTTTLTTGPIVYQPALSPDYLTQSSYPGNSVVYTLQLTNAGTLSDTFDLTGSALWTTTLAASAIGPLLPGETASLAVTVTIPLDAQPGDNDLATITAASQGDSNQTISSTLTTEALFRGPLVNPTSAAGAGDPGAVVTYPLTITNIGDLTDTYNVTLLQSDWTADFPATVGPLAPNQAAAIVVNVTVPTNALAGATNLTALRFSSDQPGTFQNEAQLQTTANAIYDLELAGAAQSQTVYGDALPVTYTLQVTNTGNTTDTFSISISSTWAVTLSPSLPFSLAAGQSVWITVVVLVPDGLQSGDSDVALLTITSQGDPARTLQATLTTEVAWYSTYLPVLLNH